MLCKSFNLCFTLFFFIVMAKGQGNINSNKEMSNVIVSSLPSPILHHKQFNLSNKPSNTILYAYPWEVFRKLFT